MTSAEHVGGHQTDEGEGVTSAPGAPLVLFDGVCNLCNATVQWIIERDRDGVFRFASLQSEAARQALQEADPTLDVAALPDSIVLVDERGIRTRSAAAMGIARHLGFPYSLMGLGAAVPRPLRDAVYRFVARNRYRWFGRRDTCMMPTPDLAARFLDADEPRPTIAEADPRDDGDPRPSWLTAWLFRLAIVYVVVYVAPFPLRLLGVVFAIPGVPEIPGLGAAYAFLTSLYGMFMTPVVTWVGASVFGVEATLEITGSGDRTFNYVDMAVDVFLAVTISLVWVGVAARKRVSARVFDASHVLARYFLATTMLSYGWIKLFPLQFPLPGPDRLIQPYGDSSPMGLAWTFLGASVGYQMFAGLSELLGGYLLFWRRTSLIGAAISAAVMTNVTAINFFFDVPVKLFSAHLVLIGLFVVMPDLPRLVGMFGFGLPTSPRKVVPFWRGWGPRAGVVMALHLAFVGLLTKQHVSGNLQRSYATGVLSEPSPLDGVYRVSSFEQGGAVDRELPDRARWVRVGLNAPGYVTVQRASGDAVRMRMVVDEDAGTMSFYDRGGQPPPEPMFRYALEGGEVLRLEGEFEGKRTIVTMRKEAAGSLLTDRGYHWINEYPFNR